MTNNDVQDAKEITVGESATTYSDWVGVTDPNDYYRFTLDQSSRFNLSLTELADRANVELLDSSGAVLVNPNNYTTSDVNINVQLLAGTYYIRVHPSYSDDNTDYNLTVAATPVIDAGNTFSDARDITIGNDPSIFSDWVGVTDPNDYYRFTLTQDSDFNLSLTELADRANVELLDSSGAVLVNPDNYTTSDVNINVQLLAGTYYIRVHPSYSNDNTDYNLTVAATPVIDDGDPPNPPNTPKILYVDELRRDRSKGFVINGLEQGDKLGRSLDVKDINEDGKPDLIIGGWALRTVTPEEATDNDYPIIINFSEYIYTLVAGYVLYGQEDGFSVPVDLASLDSRQGFVVKGKVEGLYSTDEAGTSVAVWDADNDGILDIAFGAPEANTADSFDAGRVYVLKGTQNGFPANVELRQLDGNDGFRITGMGTRANFGFDVNNAGDINADGYDDLIIGAPGLDSAYLIFGGQEFSEELDVKDLDGVTNGFRIVGNQGDGTGFSVAGAGDVNGDGRDDLLVLSRSSRKTHVIFSRSGPFAPSLHLDQLNGRNGFTIINDELPKEVEMVGDVNGDDLDDMALTGRYGTFLIYGKRGGFPATLDLQNLDPRDGLKFEGIGGSVAGGDINDDGINDLIIGDPRKEVDGKTAAGITAVIFGRRTELINDIWTLDSSKGFIIAGSESFNQLGTVVKTGDVDGDGIEDVIVSTEDGPNGYSSGQVVVVYGQPSPIVDLKGSSDLTPYQPSGWDDPLVISIESGTNTDAGQITTEDPLYIDWAALNQGTGATVNDFRTRLFLDDVVISDWVTNAPLDTKFYTFVQDFQLDALSAGNHTLTLEVDYLGQEKENNEKNNVFEKEFTVVSVNNSLPDLTPYQPQGWDGAIIISTEAGTNTDAGQITTEDTLLIDWAALNQGTGATVNDFRTRLSLDGVVITDWVTNPPLDPNFYTFVEDFQLDALSAGNHTLTLEVDYLGQEKENNEKNNVFEKNFTVVNAFNPIDGTNGDDKLRGTAKNDLIDGKGGNDQIFGRGGHDLLKGGLGKDTIKGDSGDDILHGGAGSDRLYGNKGADQFVLGAGEGTDTVVDYQDEQDSFLLAGGLSFGQLEIKQDNGDTLFNLAGSGELLAILQGVEASQIGAEDFAVLV